MTLAPDRVITAGRRHFTVAGQDVYDSVVWEFRDAQLIDHRDGSVVF